MKHKQENSGTWLFAALSLEDGTERKPVFSGCHIIMYGFDNSCRFVSMHVYMRDFVPCNKLICLQFGIENRLLCVVENSIVICPFVHLSMAVK